MSQAVQNTVAAVEDLYAAGARDLLYFEVPNLSLVPAYMRYGALAGQLANDFNRGVLSGIAPLETTGVTVFVVPIYNAVQTIVTDGGADGLTHLAQPCFSGAYDTPGTVCSDPASYLFWDQEHPTAAAHALTADVAYDILQGNPDPIGDPAGAPEPSTWAMMLTGLAGLGLVRYRLAHKRAVAKARR